MTPDLIEFDASSNAGGESGEDVVVLITEGVYIVGALVDCQ